MSRRIFLLLFFLFVGLSLVACRSGVNEASSPEEVLSVPVVSPAQSVVAPVLDSQVSGEAPVLRDYNVYYADGSLFPRSVFAREGDLVKLNFMLGKNRFVSLPDFGVVQRVANNVVFFRADRTGSYSLLCLDCDDPDEPLMVHVK